MDITFYNHYGVGDLFESREFVKDWMKLCGVTTARYAHRLLPGFFDDLPGIESVAVLPEMDPRRALTWFQDYSTPVAGPLKPGPGVHLWVNTWIGARNAETQPPGDYVVWPGVGCTVEHLYRMHNDYLREAGLPKLPRDIVEYLPTIDYRRVECGMIGEFVAGMKRQGKRLVLLCNGPTGSGHASNFSFITLLHSLPVRDDVVYLLTENPPLSGVNEAEMWRLNEGDVWFTDELTFRAARGGCDVNAISYLSRSCDLIVGRCSGAQMPTQVLENWMDSTKTLVCFTSHRNGACFVLQPATLGLKMQVVHSDTDSPLVAAKLLERLLA